MKSLELAAAALVAAAVAAPVASAESYRAGEAAGIGVQSLVYLAPQESYRLSEAAGIGTGSKSHPRRAVGHRMRMNPWLSGIGLQS